MSFPDDKVLFRVTIPWPLRISAKSTASFGGLRMRADGVVPFRMEQVACDIEGFHLGVADFDALFVGACVERALDAQSDRKSTRLNSSHLGISYVVFCLKKK